MSAPAGNTNASKWTREQTLLMLQKIEALALDEFSITHTLTQALLRLRCYKQLWSYWKKKWEEDADIMDQIYYIEQIFMSKLEEGALFRQLNPSACFFILKNNYGYGAKGEPELPSHLRADLEESAQPGSASGSKTKTGNSQQADNQRIATAEKHVAHDSTAITEPQRQQAADYKIMTDSQVSRR